MHLSNPLESLLRPAAAAVLLALVRVDGRMTGRQIARVTGSSSPSATLRTLRTLADTGLLHAEAQAHATYYWINRDHLLWPALRTVIDTRSRLADLIRARTDAAAPAGTTVALYGSTARNSSRADSDVDLLVVFPDATSVAERDAFGDDLATAVQRWTGNRAEVYDLTTAQLRALIEEGDPLTESWRRDAEVVIGSALEPLRSR